MQLQPLRITFPGVPSRLRHCQYRYTSTAISMQHSVYPGLQINKLHQTNVVLPSTVSESRPGIVPLNVASGGFSRLLLAPRQAQPRDEVKSLLQTKQAGNQNQTTRSMNSLVWGMQHPRSMAAHWRHTADLENALGNGSIPGLFQ